MVEKIHQSKKTHSADRLGDLLRNNDRQLSHENYTRIIRMLRIFLPLTAIGIMAILIVISQAEEDFSNGVDSLKFGRPATNELTKPRFESRDKKDQPFTITANKAIQSETQKDKVFLDKPMADMTTENGTWVAVEADQGEYSQDGEKLVLQGNVHLFEDGGYSLRTQMMHLNLNDNTAFTDQPVEAHGPAGILEAKGLTAIQKQNKLIFKGPAKLTLHNSDDTQLLPE